jgi:glutathione reductase (NADPH)
MDFDLFVIGGGSAGVRCARISAGHGARVGIAEERFWGGTCVNVGCVPKKLLVQAGEYSGWADDAAGFGWTIHKGPHDWGKLIAAKDREIARLEGIYRKLLTGAGATVFDGKAVLVDPHTVEVAGKRVTAERIVIATGGHPERPDIPGADLGIISDDAFFLKTMPRHVVMVGSGYISLEFAGIFRALGAEVHLVYRQPLPLRGFDHDIREAMEAALMAQGIILHPKNVPTKLEADGDRRILTLGDGQTIISDMVFFATGRRPNVRGLGLDSVGIELNAKGAIKVDEQLRTSQPHIYAMGDVTDRVNLTPVATAEGHALADSLFGNNPRTVSMWNIPSAVFTTPPVATVGLSEEQASAMAPVDIYLTRFTPLRHALSGRDRKTTMKLVVDNATQKVVGAHMLGEDAAEIIQGIAIAIMMGATKSDFDRTIGVHPTAAEEFVTLRTRTRTTDLAKAAE